MTDEEIRDLLHRHLHRYRECHEGVTRAGVFEPCDKAAVAVRIDPEERAPYPVCSRHARGEMVPLTVLASLLGDAR